MSQGSRIILPTYTEHPIMSPVAYLTGNEMSLHSQISPSKTLLL
jgi:hypothetical protein